MYTGTRATMIPNRNLVLLLCLSSCLFGNTKTINETRYGTRKFPPGFMFGTSTASYQVEGAWDTDGKSENIWDHLTHNRPDLIKDKSNGDVADDSYHQYKRDVEMMRELGIDFYRFSLSWTRLLPTSFPNKINKAGVEYYNNLINEMLKYNIEPMVTLYHWDLPQRLQEMGGWTNPHIVDWFSDYARVCFELFGDRVKYWITVNEPREICYQGYSSGKKAPALSIKGYGEYLCSKNLLLAHAISYHIYDQEFRAKYRGFIGITISASWFEPKSEKDIDAALDTMAFELGVYAHPIFSKTGDFPKRMKDVIAAKSASQGFFRSRLPEFTQEEIDMVRGSSDFFGLNHYTTIMLYRNESVINYYEKPSYEDDIGAIFYQPNEWPSSTTSWLKNIPWGFYKVLTFIREEYNNPTVFITENGFSSSTGFEDTGRIDYYISYLDAMLDAMDEGSDVKVYTAWSLMDNFEWFEGYVDRFGMYEVDYESPERTRTPRKSAFVYKEIVRTRAIDYHYEPDTTVMTIEEGH